MTKFPDIAMVTLGYISAVLDVEQNRKATFR
jgi:hypothetical protein